MASAIVRSIRTRLSTVARAGAVSSSWKQRAVHTCKAASAIRVQVGDDPNVPTVDDVSVNITFVNYNGIRTTVRGRVGQSLLEVAQQHDYEFLDGACGGGGGTYAIKQDGLWTEDQYGEGAACSFCHVIIAPDLAPILPEPLRDESLRLGLLEDPSSKVEGLSRLGCQIKVTKDMEGMVVHCPDSGYSDIP